MGLFDFFKKKTTEEGNQRKSVETSLSNFRQYYLYGFTDNPNQVANDKHLIAKVYRNVIGDVGGIAITNSFHPYFIVNQKGTTVWQVAYVKLFANEQKDKLFSTIIQDKAVYAIDTASTFNEINVWPDTRLTYEENPEFSRYVPFIVPFLVYDSGQEMRWDYEIRKAVSEKGHASDYVGEVTNSLRFLMPEPAFVLGFAEFDEKSPSALIDNFINCKDFFAGS